MCVIWKLYCGIMFAESPGGKEKERNREEEAKRRRT